MTETRKQKIRKNRQSCLRSLARLGRARHLSVKSLVEEPDLAMNPFYHVRESHVIYL